MLSDSVFLSTIKFLGNELGVFVSLFAILIFLMIRLSQYCRETFLTKAQYESDIKSKKEKIDGIIKNVEDMIGLMQSHIDDKFLQTKQEMSLLREDNRYLREDIKSVNEKIDKLILKI